MCTTISKYKIDFGGMQKVYFQILLRFIHTVQYAPGFDIIIILSSAISPYKKQKRELYGNFLNFIIILRWKHF